MGRPNLFWSETGLLPLRSEYNGQILMQYANRQRSASSLSNGSVYGFIHNSLAQKRWDETLYV
jgi:hypothetical protein